MLVTGTVSAPTRGECARCLTPITGDVEIDLTELFAYPDSATEATTEDDEVGHVVDDTVDLEQPIVDAVGLALPFSPLCARGLPGAVPGVRCRRWPPPSPATITTRSTRGGPSWRRCCRLDGSDDPEQGRGDGDRRAACSTRSASSCPTIC